MHVVSEAWTSLLAIPGGEAHHPLPYTGQEIVEGLKSLIIPGKVELGTTVYC